MATSKRRAAKAPAATRARTSRTNPATVAAAQDIAESQRRANAAKTPIAKAATKRVVERKKQVYTDEAVRQAAALVKQSGGSASIPARKRTRGANTRGKRR
jgi:hypothetical protein